MAFKRIREWLKQPFLKRTNKPERIVTFGELGVRVGERPWIVMILCLFIVIFAELLMQAEGIANSDARFVWGAAALTGFLFIMFTVWIVPEKFSVLESLYHLGWLKDISLGFLTGLAGMVWVGLSSWVLMKLFPTFFFGLFFNNWLYESSYLIIAVASAGIMRPLGEELLFRKYFLGKFTQKYSTPLAVIFSSLLFGLRKLDPFLFVIYGGIGLINGAVFIRSNIRVAVIANITTSLLIILVTLIYKGF